MYRVKIYQTDARWKYSGWNYAITHGFNKEDYELVFDRYVYDDVTLDSIYLALNERHPDNMRSPSVGDVFVLYKTTPQVYYVNRLGYERIDGRWL